MALPAPSDTVSSFFAGSDRPTAKLKPDVEAVVVAGGRPKKKPDEGAIVGGILLDADNVPIPNVRPDLGGDGLISDSFGFAEIKQGNTVNSEIFARILFSQRALKDIFATLKFCD